MQWQAISPYVEYNFWFFQFYTWILYLSLTTVREVASRISFTMIQSFIIIHLFVFGIIRTQASRIRICFGEHSSSIILPNYNIVEFIDRLIYQHAAGIFIHPPYGYMASSVGKDNDDLLKLKLVVAILLQLCAISIL